MTPRQVGYLALLAAATCWGSTVVLIEIAARGLSVAALTVVELLVAALALAGLLLGRRRRPDRPRLTGRIVLAGVLEPGVAYVCINAGIARTSGAHAALLLGTESVFVLVLSAAMTRRRPPALVIVGLLVAVLGAGLLADGGGAGASLRGDLLVLVGALAAAGYVVLVQPISGRIDAMDLTAYQFLVGTVVAVPFALFGTGHVTLGAHPRPGYWVAAVAVGVLGSVAAFGLYNWALPRISAGAAGGSLTLIPLLGLVFSVIFLGDPLSLRTVVAAVGVLAGLSLIVVSESRGQVADPPEPVRYPQSLT